MELPKDKIRFKHGAAVAVGFSFLLMIFAIAFGFYNPELQELGIRPRRLDGALGIITAPILHGDLNHLISNIFPLLIAIPGLFYFYYRQAVPVLIVVYVLSGFWVWLSARDSVHLGASGVVNGLLAFLFIAGILQRTKAGVATALAILFLYGIPIITGFAPSPGISYESHIAGATAGTFMAVYFGVSNFYQKKSSTSNISSSTEEEITFQYFYKPENESKDQLDGEDN